MCVCVGGRVMLNNCVYILAIWLVDSEMNLCFYMFIVFMILNLIVIIYSMHDSVIYSMHNSVHTKSGYMFFRLAIYVCHHTIFYH